MTIIENIIKWGKEMKVKLICVLLVLLSICLCLNCESKEDTVTSDVDEECEECPEPKLVFIEYLSGHVVQYYGNDNRDDYPVSKTMDNNYATFWTTQTLSLNDVKVIAYKLLTPTNIESISITDNYTNKYNLGDLKLYTSTDSTNGADGTWNLITEMNASNNTFVNGDGTILINDTILWVRLIMTYTGTGAHGSTPTFYISEIDFNLQ